MTDIVYVLGAVVATGGVIILGNIARKIWNGESYQPEAAKFVAENKASRVATQIQKSDIVGGRRITRRTRHKKNYSRKGR
jgi:hypothetical protein